MDWSLPSGILRLASRVRAVCWGVGPGAGAPNAVLSVRAEGEVLRKACALDVEGEGGISNEGHPSGFQGRWPGGGEVTLRKSAGSREGEGEEEGWPWPC